MPTLAFSKTVTALCALLATGNALAQSTAERVFHFAHTPSEQNAREIATAISTITGLKDTSIDFPAGVFTLRGAADQLDLAEWLFLGMDRSGGVPLDPAVHEYRLPNGPDNVVRLFYLDRGQTMHDFQEFATVLRATAEIPRVFPYNGGKILSVRGTPDQIGMADYFVNELEKSAGVPHSHSVTAAYLLPAFPDPQPNENVTRIFFAAEAPTVQDLQELATLIRTIANIRRLFTYNPQKAITVRGSPDELALVEWLFNEIDQPRIGASSHASPLYDYQDATPAANGSSVRVFYLPHTATVEDFQKIAVTIRTETSIRRMSTYNSPRAMVLRGTLNQVEQARQLLTQLDPADFPKSP